MFNQLHDHLETASELRLLEGKRVLLVLNDAGNFFSHREPLARMLLEQGADVHVIAPGTALAARCKDYGVAYTPCNLSQWGMSPLQEVKTVRSLSSIYKQLQPDIIHHFTIKPVLYGTIAAMRSKARVINTITGLGYIFLSKGLASSLRRTLIKSAYRFIKRSCSQIVFQNEWDATYFVEEGLCDAKRSSVIQGAGVYLDELYTVPFPTNGPIRVLLPARLLREKGIYEFAEAAASLKNSFSDVEFLLAGQQVEGSPSAIPRDLIDTWERNGIVTYMGFQPSVAEMLRKVHIVCLPSYREGLARCLVEGAAAGRVLVASDVPGCRDLIIDRENGVLVKAQSASSLEEGLRYCLEHRDRLHRMGDAGKRRFQNSEFSAERIQKSYLSVYQSVLQDLNE